MFIDTHSHIYTSEFDADRSDVIARAVAAGAEAILLPAIDAASLPDLLAVCDNYPALCRPMAGLHPTELPPTPTEVEAALDDFEALLANDAEGERRFVAVGEVGIDLYWDTSRKEEQVRAFARQAEWAARFDLPLMVHARSAQREIVETLHPIAQACLSRHARALTGVFHCFGGEAEDATELLETFPGFVLGIGGVVTYKKSTLPDALKAVPLQRIVLETDAPYLAPVPHRGRRNEPAFIPHIINRLADIYNCPPEEIAAVTTATARKLFKTIGRR